MLTPQARCLTICGAGSMRRELERLLAAAPAAGAVAGACRPDRPTRCLRRSGKWQELALRIFALERAGRATEAANCSDRAGSQRSSRSSAGMRWHFWRRGAGRGVRSSTCRHPSGGAAATSPCEEALLVPVYLCRGAGRHAGREACASACPRRRRAGGLATAATAVLASQRHRRHSEKPRGHGLSLP